MWIVITGNPVSGFDFVGPFSYPATAMIVLNETCPAQKLIGG